MSFYTRLFQILTRQERQQMLLVLGLMLVVMILEMFSLGLIIPAIGFLFGAMQGQYYIDNYLQGSLSFKFFNNLSSYQWMIGGVLVLVTMFFFKTLFFIGMNRKINKFIFSLQANLSRRLFAIYLFQPWQFHLQRNPAQLTRNTIMEADAFLGTVMLPLLSILTESAILVGINLLLFMVEPIGTFVTMALFGLFAFCFYYFSRDRFLSWGNLRQLKQGLRLQYIQEGLAGIKDSKLLGRENYFLNAYDIPNQEAAKSSRKNKDWSDLPRLGLELFGVVGLTVLTLVMIGEAKCTTEIMTGLTVFAAAAFRLIPSINRILNGLQALRNGYPVLNLIYSELTELKSKQPSAPHQPFLFKQNILLQQVSFAYEHTHIKTVDSINVSISYGEAVGFVGTSGAGKSTLVDIILGLLPPTMGQVKVDGVDIQSNVRAWQNNIGYVSQMTYLMDDTLRKNIAFGISDEDIDDAAVSSAINLAQLNDFVNSLSDGLNTMVGDRGIRLSGGQRQRIAIARALYHDPAVLVLDEATSSLDTATEQAVMESINALHGTKTLIIVAHRLSTVAHCDRLYRIESGKLVAEGSYEHVINEYVSSSSLTN